MKIWVVVCLLFCNVLISAPKKPRASAANTQLNITGNDGDDLSDKEVVKAILPHLALVVKSFFIIVQEHQNFNSVITNIGQMIMSFFTIGSYMLRTPNLEMHNLPVVRSAKKIEQTNMLALLAQQYCKVHSAHAAS